MTQEERGMIHRHILAGAVAATVLSAFPAFTQEAEVPEDLKTLQDQGFARIAIANEPPFTAVNADGSVSGAGPDVARAVFKRLGVDDVVASISEYGAMIPGLQARRFDAVTAGLFMRPERCAAVAYSEPILCDAEAFALKAGNPLNLQSYKDIADNPDARIGAPGGGTEERLALEAGVPRDRVIVVPDTQSGIAMLQQGRIDVYSLPVLSINAAVKTAADPNIEVVAPVQGAPIYCDGAAFRRDQTDLRDAFDRELAALKESGEFAQIVEPYGFSAEAAISSNREQLCAQQ
jgi:polar amino acid transport system substrate-binding protein